RADGVLRVVAEAAWDGGDPGVVFLDRITGCLPYDYPSVSRALGEIDTLVPCGEQSMHPNETCGLGAVNLAADAFWRQERGAWRFNERSFSETVELAVRALDRAQSLTDFAGDAALQKASRATRRIGLGLMGWHDAVQSRALGAEEQAALLRTVGLLFRAASHQASAALGREVGSCQLATDCPRAHLTVTCVPPTGGITLLAGNRSFALDPLPQELDRMSVGRQLASARDWQPYFDYTISKTINVPFDATPQDVHNVFLAALETGLKTLTVYRSGSRSHQPLQTHHASCETC
ncbi:MAG TPA: hypothetical protein VKA74_02840, partial [Myxococcota bacterium]|nr:hypothetical protein [Myxococcota bacterium]